jgi:hypothetical protein
MAMTAAVKDELSRLAVTKPCCRRAEVAALLRFAGGLHIVGGRVVVEAEVAGGGEGEGEGCHGLRRWTELPSVRAKR